MAMNLSKFSCPKCGQNNFSEAFSSCFLVDQAIYSPLMWLCAGCRSHLRIRNGMVEAGFFGLMGLILTYVKLKHLFSFTLAIICSVGVCFVAALLAFLYFCKLEIIPDNKWFQDASKKINF